RETGQRQAAADVGHKHVDAVAAARASGLADPVLDVGLGLGRDLQGQEGALAQGIRDSIRAGWRNPPEELELLDPGDRQGADFDSVIAEMAAVLEAERRKYLAAKDRVATES
ncbi:MAG TPA: hypothetical protein VLT59_04140, partial [Steroidobacteraceae bacterium]|nr:hypothetical protein [Steroidobacteraceae bacterium]